MRVDGYAGALGKVSVSVLTHCSSNVFSTGGDADAGEPAKSQELEKVKPWIRL